MPPRLDPGHRNGDRDFAVYERATGPVVAYRAALDVYDGGGGEWRGRASDSIHWDRLHH